MSMIVIKYTLSIVRTNKRTPQKGVLLDSYLAFAAVAARRLLKRSTRPAVSITFSVPV